MNLVFLSCFLISTTSDTTIMPASPSIQPSMVHILEVVFALPPDSALHRAMEGNMYTAPKNFIMESDETIDDFIFRGDDKKNVKRPKAEVGLLKTFKQFVAHQQLQGIHFGTNNWVNITQDEFNKF